MDEATYKEPSAFSIAFSNATYAIRQVPRRAKEWLTRKLVRAVVALVGDTDTILHAKRELAASLADDDSGPNRWMADDLIELLAVFSAQGHSGFSASYCTSAVEKLMRFEPLGPLTGDEDEWIDHGYCMQNKRCCHVFMQPDRFDGQAYDSQARIFRDPDGSCFTSGESAVPITFPYVPKREYVDVSA